MTRPDPENMTDEASRLGRQPLVDFGSLGRRLRRTAVVLAVVVLVGWVASIPFVGVDFGVLMNLVGLALAGMFVAEVVIVGGSAMKGMLRAGERGERLASEGVGLLPPQLTRGRRGGAEDPASPEDPAAG